MGCRILALLVAAALLLAGCAGQRKEIITPTPTAVTNLTQITKKKAPDVYPAISTDATRLAFQRRQKDNYDVWVVDAATGRGYGQVTNHPLDDRNPSWFPDGQMLVFDSPRVDTYSIWRKSATGSGGVTQITRGTVVDFDADVSPNGRRIAFTSQVEEAVFAKHEEGMQWQLFVKALPYIWIVDSTGSNLTQFGEGISPAWSPDGEKVAFASNEAGNFDIWVMDADGGNVTQLTSHKENDIDPCWSPDGTKIAFASRRVGPKEKANYNIWVMSADGGNLTQLTIDEAYDGAPSWSSDGDIYFHTNRGGDWNIWRLTPLLHF